METNFIEKNISVKRATLFWPRTALKLMKEKLT
ncbi:hypothetical protein QF042_004735 [Pedobacter sp. W3I1]|nr:hypothetical protein [Pedobacter sp. W3I1]